MKKIQKKTLWIFCAIAAFLFMWGKGAPVFAGQTVVPAAGSGNAYQFQIPEGKGLFSVPVSISQAGMVYLDIDAQTEADTFSAVLSDRADARDNAGWLDYGIDKKMTLSSYAKGTRVWYLHLIRSQADAGKADSVSVRAYQKAAVAGNGTLKKGKWTSIYMEGKGSVTYKIKVPSTGCLTLEMSSDNEDAELESALLNKKKKKISLKSSGLMKTYYGVKKGVYYMKVDNKSGKGEICDIRYTFEKIGANKNTSSSKMVNLKKGKKSKGVFVSGEKKTARWYKINLSKSQTLKCTVTMKTNAFAGTFSLVQPELGMGSTGVLKNGKNTFKTKLKPGLYYLVLNVSNSKCEGSYVIQWK